MTLSLPKDTLPAGVAFFPVEVPGSKSITNRALLLAAMAPGMSLLRGGLDADDTRWMRESLWTLGLPVVAEDGEWKLTGGMAPGAAAPLYLGASGTTLRFLLPWLALRSRVPLRLTGEPRLFERPLAPLLNPLLALGAKWVPHEGGAWLHPVPQEPERLDALIDGSLSSQFISGLAMAAAGLPKGGHLHWAEPVASRSYLDVTRRWLARFGCVTELLESEWLIPGGRLHPVDLDLPGDWSGAAAFLAAAAVMGRGIKIAPLEETDPQGDKAMVDILVEAGCTAQWDGLQLFFAGPLRTGIRADLALCPDLGPVLAAASALAPEPSVLTGLHTLRNKECDRLDASAELVRWLGGEAEIVGEHTLKIRPGKGPAERPPFDPRDDHRMAFAAAVGALRCGGDLLNPDCVAKTFPTFWKVWASMLQSPS